MSKISDKFINQFSEKGKRQKKNQEELAEKEKKAHIERDEFLAKFKTFFESDLKSKLAEIKSELQKIDSDFNYENVIKRQSNDIYGFQMTVMKHTFYTITILVLANLKLKKIDILYHSANKNFDKNIQKDFSNDIDNFTVDKFEEVFFEILRL
jgi:hypothetical protein